MAGLSSIRRLLVANRGEIACRVARTAHRLGMETVGVYSRPDANALHVDVVDRAVALAGSAPAETYLRRDLLVRAAVDTGCDAVHPGYGFLAENADFARAVVDAGLIWVGPAPDQIALLGDKVAAKQAAIAAGVPTRPVYSITAGEIPDGVPMPALVKAAAGGGGRGMRIVRDPAALEEAIAEASREAASAFGDGTVFVEPYVERGRHVEVQIIGDHHGSVLHLGERECSIQRRNQKIVEEAPAPGIDDVTRHRLWEGALALARAVGYRNAGTVEFLVGHDGTVDFLEVNTRLQVEHPVTEALTGLDLVELQLLVAAGEPLPLTQDAVRLDGHAIEARLVAEDPARGWLPSAGTITAFAVADAVRTDTGVRVGSTVSTDYDSLLAKVIAHAPDRSAAVSRLRRALRAAHIAGVRTNRDTLVAILGDDDFLGGSTPTTYLEEHPNLLTAAGPEGDDRLALLLAAAVHRAAAHRASPHAFATPGWRNLRTMGQRSTWLDPAGVETDLEETWHDDAAATVLVGPWPRPGEDGALGPDERRSVALRVVDPGPGRLALEIDGVRHRIAVGGDPATGITATGAQGGVTWTLVPRFVEHAAGEAGSGPVCPLPGTVIAVSAEAGQRVEDGDLLMVIEAMKMEHKVTATAPGTVVAVRFAVGDRVDAGELLVEVHHEEA